MQRRQALGDHPLEVELGEPGERREVPVEERQAVVVVLQVQAAAHARGQLVDEAERAVVVARAHLVEQGRLHRGAQRLALGLGHHQVVHEAAAAHLELGVGGVDQQAPGDDVAGHLAVDREHLVADAQPGALGGRTGLDGHDHGGLGAGAGRGGCFGGRHGRPAYRARPG